ncbi:MAG: hypothetical protein ACYC3L_10195 [Gemmatimonadaceae bacterium]
MRTLIILLTSATIASATVAPAQQSASGMSRSLTAVTRFREAGILGDSGRVVEAGEAYRDAARSSRAIRVDASYRAAAAFGRAGDPDRTSRALAEALEAGYRDADELLHDDDLAVLHGRSEWPRLVAKAGENDRRFRHAHSDPARARFITEDLGRLHRLLPLPTGDGAQRQRAAIIAADYLGAGSDGLVAFHALGKIRDAEVLAGTIAALPGFYGSLNTIEAALAAQTTTLRAAFARFARLVPGAYFPDVYFVVGHFRSGGTSVPIGLLIGTEIYGRTPGVSLDEIPAGSRGIVQPMSQVAGVVIHELVHFHQSGGGASPTLLRATIVEGSADFVAHLVFPDMPEPDYRAWGRLHDEAVRARFAAEMRGVDISNWIANNDRETAEWPAALGYYVGYRIAEGYYRRAPDKTRAIRELMRLADPEAILTQSGYLSPP